MDDDDRPVPGPPKPAPYIVGASGEEDNVAVLNITTPDDIPIERVLLAAREDLASGVIVGWCHDGSIFFASSIADGADVLWLLEIAKLRLMRVAGEIE